MNKNDARGEGRDRKLFGDDRVVFILRRMQDPPFLFYFIGVLWLQECQQGWPVGLASIQFHLNKSVLEKRAAR